MSPLLLAAVSNGVLIGLGIFAGIVLIIVLFMIGQFFSLWVQALVSGARVRLIDLIMMKFRKVDPRTIVFNRISAKKAGLELSTDFLESHYLAGGRVTNVVRAMIAADKARIDLPWDRATAIDLAGRDILDAVKTSVDPKVIDCPHQSGGSDKLDAVAKDGIRLLCRARVTVRTNMARLVGGATEETVIARVGQAIVSAIGSAATYKDVLENPDHIAKRALASGLDAGTAFEILSVDIADISVAGVDREANVGAKLQGEQAEADKKRFQAQAENRRAMAIAQEAEYQAEIQKNRALVVLAEAEIPKAMAEAFRKGNLGIMDYYKMKNVMADTSMRDAISKGGEGKG